LEFKMHIAVLKKEVLKYLDPKPDENFIDCTIGEAGHALAILERNGPRGKVLGIDQDPEIIENCKLKIENFSDRLILVCDNFANLKEIVKRYNFKRVSGILFDLGISSWHLEKSGRGFSFLRAEPLDMRYHISTFFRGLSKTYYSLTAEEIVNNWPGSEIERILKEYGEEKFAKRIARGIINSRKTKPIKTTFQLVEILKKAIPSWDWRRRIHFATKTFQALRIVVNDELNNLKKGLGQALEILSPGGKLVVISFHSLEDRIVKNFLKERAREGLPAPYSNKVCSSGLKILTKKPIRPTFEEIKTNPRARSAKLRAAIKTTNNP